MLHSRLLGSFAAIASLVLTFAVAAAQEPSASSAAARAATVAPFVDDQTFVIGRLNFASFDVAVSAAKLAEVAGIPKEELEDLERENKFVQRLKTAGVTELYGVVSLADLPRELGCVLIVAKPGADLNAIAETIRKEPGYIRGQITIDSLHGKLVVANKTVLARLKELKPIARPEVERAFATAGESDAQVLLLPSSDTRRVLRELLPNLPAEVGGGPIAPLVDGFQWGALNLTLPPKKLAAQLRIQSKDAAAAEGFLGAVRGIYTVVGKLVPDRSAVPEVEKLTALMTPKVEGDQLVIEFSEERGDFKLIAAALKEPITAARDATARVLDMNHLKQQALAMHNYLDQKKTFPAAASYDGSGKPLLSWRVHLLPYLEHDALYKQFHLDEPWDSEHNRKLIDRMPEVFRSPLSKVKDPGRTTYLLPISSKHFIGGKQVVDPKTGKTTAAKGRDPNAAKSLFFGGPKGGLIQQITDGTSNTIMIVEADDDHAVIWTKPEDLEIDLENPSKGLLNPAVGGFNTSYFDGSARFIPNDFAKKNLLPLLTPAGGEVSSQP